MTLTLWRGDQLVGELLPRPSARQTSNRQAGRPPSLAAFLVRAADAPPCEGIWQVAAPILGLGVQQHPVEPDIVAQRYQRSARTQPSSGPLALHPMSPDEAKGVPVEKQLTVHDASGRVYLPLQISLLESRFEPEHYADALREAPPNALVDGVVWTILVVFASEIDAPAT
jgi:anti-sigma factor RsiW